MLYFCITLEIRRICNAQQHYTEKDKKTKQKCAVSFYVKFMHLHLIAFIRSRHCLDENVFHLKMVLD